MDLILKYDKKTIKLLDKLINREFEIKNNLTALDDYTKLNDSWLEKVMQNVTIDNLLNFVKRSFKLVELYHSCCPSNLKSYYSIGIENLNVNRIEAEFAYFGLFDR